jgi:hypothetical protein
MELGYSRRIKMVAVTTDPQLSGADERPAEMPAFLVATGAPVRTVGE